MPNDKSADYIGKKIKASPLEPPKTNIDTNKSLEDAILEAASTSTLKTDVLESFSTMAQNRETEYELIDTMAMDSIISSAIERYAEDITQTNKKGQIFWVESDDSNVARYVQYLLDKIDFDRNAYKWVYMLTKYGDVYVRLVRNSEFENSIIFGNKNKDKDRLQEDVNLIVNKKSDHYADTLETVRNPDELFEITKYGKTIAFIKAPVNVQKDFRSNNDLNSLITYKIKRNDVDIYAPTEFVHGCLESSYIRSEEELDIFMNDNDYDKSVNAETFQIKRGTGILNDLFKVWRQFSLMENSILLSRLTRSSITRAIQMEVGDMPQNQVMNITSRVKSLLEQKSALETGNKMSEYVNPGPVENIVILPTRNGKGAIQMTQIGGDYDPKTLVDLDHFVNKLAGGLKIPKPLLGFTDDNTGFNGGTSLTILSSDYGKAIKKMQKALIQMVTDAINLLLIDKGKNAMINNFKIKMQAPVTQEEIDMKSDLSNSLRNVSDIMQTLNDIDDNILKTKALKILLSETLANQDITNILEDYIKEQEEKIEKDNSEENEEPSEGNESELNDLGEMSPEEMGFNPMEGAPSTQEEEEAEESNTETSPEETTEEIPEETSETENDNLPSPADLGVDLTVNQQR